MTDSLQQAYASALERADEAYRALRLGEAEQAYIEAAAIEHGEFALETLGVDCGSGCDVDATWYEENGWMLLRVEVDVPYEPFTGLLPLLPESTHCGFVMLTQQQIFE